MVSEIVLLYEILKKKKGGERNPSDQHFISKTCFGLDSAKNSVNTSVGD